MPREMCEGFLQFYILAKKKIFSVNSNLLVFLLCYFFFFFFFLIMKRFYYELLLLNLIHTRRRRDSGSKQQSAQRTELGRRDWDEGGKGSRGGGLVVLPGPPVSKGGPIRDERATGLLSVTAPTDE